MDVEKIFQEMGRLAALEKEIGQLIIEARLTGEFNKFILLAEKVSILGMDYRSLVKLLLLEIKKRS